MRTTLTLLAVAVATFASGCATRPESISSSYVSHEKYAGQQCANLAEHMAETRAKLVEVSRKQDNMANLDAATVFLVLIPVSKLSGDHAADVARYKGEVEAIETAQIKAGCRTLAAR